MLKTKILKTLKDSLDINFNFSKSQNIILKEVGMANEKALAVAILNATEIKDEEIVLTLNDYNCEEMNWLYDDEELNQTRHFGIGDDYPPQHLLKIHEDDIITVNFEDSLPTSITFSKLKAPIISCAFQGIIQEIRFGDDDSYIFDFELYKETRTFLENYDINLPDNIFQTHYFVVYLQKYLPSSYINVFLSEALDGGFTGVFKLINILQDIYKCPSYESYDNSDEDTDISLDDINEQYINTMISSNDCPTEKCLVVFDSELVRANLLYNAGENKFMGAIDLYLPDGDFTLYRSLPDMIITYLSGESYYLFLATYCTFINDNKVIIDDGVKCKNDAYNSTGEREIETNGFDFTRYEKEILNNDESEKVTFSIGWEDEIP